MPPKKRTRQTYQIHDVQFKQEVVAYHRASGGTQRATAAHFGINERTAASWMRGQGLGPSGAPKLSASVALTVAATQRALGNMAGAAAKAVADDRGASVIKEILVRLRSLGIHIDQITRNGDSYEVSYTVKETIEL